VKCITLPVDVDTMTYIRRKSTVLAALSDEMVVGEEYPVLAGSITG
jgi:hypothetical protein